MVQKAAKRAWQESLWSADKRRLDLKKIQCIRFFLNRCCIIYPCIYSSVCYSYTDIHLKVSMTSSLFTYGHLPSCSMELAHIPLQKKFLNTDEDPHFSYFFSATVNEPAHLILGIAEPPFPQQTTHNLRGGPRIQPRTPCLSPTSRGGDGSFRPCLTRP